MAWACANRVQPTGGPKDEDPPKLLGSIPKDGQRNFKQLEVQLLFNEFITLKGLKEQLIITPRIDSEYSYKYKKRTVYVEFEEPLADSTTYTLNFREGVVDITEGLPAENLQLAFSTGSMLDTLEIKGNVVNLLTQEPLEDVTVGLYTKDDTLDLFTGPPYYFAKTDEAGNYHFRNIKDGEYRLYAFKDGNKNLTCESDREAYGFLTQTLALDTALNADTIMLHSVNLDTLEIIRSRSSGRYFNVTASKYLMNAKLQASNDSLLRYHYAEDRKGLIVYNTIDITDSLMVMATIEDSLKTIVQDTFYLSFPETTRRPSEFKLTASEFKATRTLDEIFGEITTTKPIDLFSVDSAYIEYDSLTHYPIANLLTYELDSLTNTIAFRIPMPKEIADSVKLKREQTKETKLRTSINYSLIIPKNSILSIESDTADTIKKSIIFTAPSKTGVLNGTVTTKHQSYIIQLLDNKYEVVEEQRNVDLYNFQGIKPGEYYIRILIDSNNNNEWDFSNFRENRASEPLIIYQDETGNRKTSVRANWELTVDLAF
jgi:hypothetical protein